MAKFKSFGEFLSVIKSGKKDNRLIPIEKTGKYFTEEEFQQMSDWADRIEKKNKEKGGV